MINRQRILLIAFGVAIAGYLAHWAYQSQVVAPLESKDRKIEAARKTATQRHREVIESRAAKLQLDQWKKLSLPSDPTAAVPQYQALLLDLLTQCGFDRPTINPGAPAMREQAYWRLPFEVQARGTMASLVTFLDAFYRTQLLHSLTQLNMTPIEVNRRELLDLRFSVEALALAGEPGGESSALAGENSSDPAARGVRPFAQLLDHNLLMRQGPGPALRPEFVASQVYLTGTVVAGDGSEALLYNRGTGEQMALRLGDRLAVGNVQGEVIDIAKNDLVLDLRGQWHTVALGDHLGNRKPLGAEAALVRAIQRSRSGTSVHAN